MYKRRQHTQKKKKQPAGEEGTGEDRDMSTQPLPPLFLCLPPLCSAYTFTLCIESGGKGKVYGKENKGGGGEGDHEITREERERERERERKRKRKRERERDW